MTKIIRLSGASLLDDVFTITLMTGETVTWNVTKLAAAAKAGRFGVPRYFRTADLPPANWSEWSGLDREKVDAIKKLPAALDDPAIAIESPNPNFLFSCFADGQHRITARQELGLKEIAFYVVPLAMERAFRVTGFDQLDELAP